MSTVRRCDNPACVKGPGGSIQSSDIANPAGWIVVSAETIGAATLQGDFCTIECAGQALLAGQPFELTPATAK